MGFFSKLKKLFKKVTSSTIGKVAFGVLGAAAVVFTGGAALGLAPMAGGWGAAVGSLGLTGTIGSAVTGAITAAGYGAAMGGLASAVMGGDILEGAASGGLLGGIAGGAMGGLGFNVDPLAGTFEAAQPTGGIMAPGGGISAPGGGIAPFAPEGGALGFNSASAAPNMGQFGGAVAPAAPVGGLMPAGPATPAAGYAPTGPATVPTNTGGFLSQGGWVERNGALVGSTLAGVGQGLMTGMSAKDSSDNELAIRREVAQGYTIDPNVAFGLDGAPQGDVRRPTPSQRWDRRDLSTPSAVARYEWNPDSRRIERRAQA